jgi:hypothetical protein
MNKEELINRKSNGQTSNETPNENKVTMSKGISSDTEAFLAAGGSVTQVVSSLDETGRKIE